MMMLKAIEMIITSRVRDEKRTDPVLPTQKCFKTDRKQKEPEVLEALRKTTKNGISGLVRWLRW